MSALLKKCSTLVIVILCIFCSCKSSKKAQSTHDTPDVLLIEMRKTPCRGYCPVYTFRLMSNGNATFIGEENVPRKGTFVKKISEKEIENIIDAFEKIPIWDLKDEYLARVTDLPTTYLTIEHNNKKKHIRDYYGAPNALKEFEEKIEAIALGDGWK
jgi:hypothetical protein